MWVLVSVGLIRVSVSRVLLCRRRVPRATWTRPWCPAGPTPPGILLPGLAAAWSTHHQQMGWEGFFAPGAVLLDPAGQIFSQYACCKMFALRLFFWGWLSLQCYPNLPLPLDFTLKCNHLISDKNICRFQKNLHMYINNIIETNIGASFVL